MSDADRDHLAQLWKSWGDAKDRAGKDAVQKELLAAMTDVGNRDLDATRTAVSGFGGAGEKDRHRSAIY